MEEKNPYTRKKRKSRPFDAILFVLIFFTLVLAMGYIVEFWDPENKIRNTTAQQPVTTRVNASQSAVSFGALQFRARQNHVVHSRGAEGLAVFGDVIVSGSWDDGIALTHGMSGDVLAVVPDAHGSDIVDIEFSPNGAFFLTLGLDRRLRFWTAQGRYISQLPIFSVRAIDAAIELVDNEMLVAVALLSGKVGVYHYDTLRRVAEFTHSTRTFSTAVIFAARENLLASAAADGTILLWDLSRNARHAMLNGHSSRITALSLSPDGHTLASAGWDRRIVLWDLRTQNKKAEFRAREQWALESITFSPDGSYILAGDRRGAVLAWELSTGTLESIHATEAGRVYDIKFSGDGTLLALVCYDKSLRIYDRKR